MRFLLKPTKSPQIKLASSTSALKTNATQTTAKAWGQQCSPNCGCVLRFEVQLSPPSGFTTSPTVLDASYQAKRVITKSSHNGLQPLLTTHPSLSSRPILTSCTCPTLHQLAQQVVGYLPGKSLQTLKNETDLGLVGVRTSIPFRHTVLKENVLPVLKANEKKWSVSMKERSNKSNNETSFNETEQHFHCYDLVEESILSLIHERHIGARKDSLASSFSSTMGGYFAMYNRSKGISNPFDDAGNDPEEHISTRRSLLQSEGSGWLRMSPSSYFLFGEDNAAVSTINYSQHAKDTVITLIFGRTEEGKEVESSMEEQRPTTTYLQLLDLYGNASEDEMKEDMLDDWVNYVDQVRDQNTTTG
jgi:hypothetical protein